MAKKIILIVTLLLLMIVPLQGCQVPSEIEEGIVKVYDITLEIQDALAEENLQKVREEVARVQRQIEVVAALIGVDLPQEKEGPQP